MHRLGNFMLTSYHCVAAKRIMIGGTAQRACMQQGRRVALMVLHFQPRLIISDKTPEFVWRTDDSIDHWHSTWMPGRVLDYQAAISVMVLDEVLSDPTPTDPDLVLELAEIRAADLGLTLREVVELLAFQVERRDAERQCFPSPLSAHHPGRATPLRH